MCFGGMQTFLIAYTYSNFLQTESRHVGCRSYRFRAFCRVVKCYRTDLPVWNHTSIDSWSHSLFTTMVWLNRMIYTSGLLNDLSVGLLHGVSWFNTSFNLVARISRVSHHSEFLGACKWFRQSCWVMEWCTSRRAHVGCMTMGGEYDLNFKNSIY